MLVRLFLIYIITLTTYSQHIISGAETNNNYSQNGCSKLCRQIGKDNYNNPVSISIPSNDSTPQETYPGSNEYVCVPCDCGNGQLDELEECDPNNKSEKILCTVNCKKFSSLCGNGIIDPQEECDNDLANGYESDKCRLNCKLPRCGDNILDSNEICDTNLFSINLTKPASIPQFVFDKKKCSDTCTVLYDGYCGDNIKNGDEQCDNTDFSGFDKPNSVPDEAFNSKKCSKVCNVIYSTFCGDGVKNGDELCEDSDFTGLTKPAGMPDDIFNSKSCDPVNCKPIYDPYCGDGAKNGDEQCDNTDFSGFIKPNLVPDEAFNSKKCSNDCKVTYSAFCGDGVKNGNEQCEDSDFTGLTKPAGMPENIFNSKSCNPVTCTPIFDPYCGDGAKNGDEQCEDSDFTGLTKPAGMPDNIFNSKSCDPVNCKPIYDPYCGDGIISIGEDCDDHNQVNGDSCSNVCLNEDPCLNAAPPQVNCAYSARQECVKRAKRVDGFSQLTASVANGAITSVTTIQIAAPAAPAAPTFGGFGGFSPIAPTANYTQQTEVTYSAGYLLGDACWACACRRISGCFALDQKILLSDGTEKNASDIAAGDEIKTASGKSKVNSVIMGGEDNPLIEISTKLGSIKISEKHIFVGKHGLLKAKDLKLGDEIRSKDGFVKVDKISTLPVKLGQSVINFEFDSESKLENDHLIETPGGLYSGDLYLQNSIE